MLLNQLFKPTDENYRLLKEFNETLKEVVIKNYQQSRELYYNTKKMLEDSGSSLQFEGVECKIFLGKDRQYSKSNPFQGEESEMIWEILNDESYNDIYCKYGCCMSFDGYHGENGVTTYTFISISTIYTTIQASASSTSFMLGTSTQSLN